MGMWLFSVHQSNIMSRQTVIVKNIAYMMMRKGHKQKMTVIVKHGARCVMGKVKGRETTQKRGNFNVLLYMCGDWLRSLSIKILQMFHLHVMAPRVPWPSMISHRISTAPTFRTLQCRGAANIYRVGWVISVASPVMGDWGTCPPSTSNHFNFSSLWSKSDSQLSKYCVVCEISWWDVNNSQLFRSV